MANNKQDWERLGRNIQDIVDQAVNSNDFQKLNQTISQVVDRVVDVGSEAVRRVMDGSTRPASGNGSNPKQEAKRPAPPAAKNLPALYGSTSGKTAAGILKIVGGSLISIVTLGLFISSLVFGLLVSGSGIGTVSGVLSLLGIGGGAALIGSGVRTLGLVSRFKAYRKTLGEKTHCTLEKLARSVGKSVKFVRRELRRMIDEGLFLEGHLDREETCLITSDETYRHFEQSRIAFETQKRRELAEKAQAEQTARAKKAEAAAKKTDPRIREVLDRGNAFLAELRRCNDAIPGEEISAKISRMETIVQRIFQRAEAHPEIIPDLKKMMDYYLPMTVKLLNAYADMDAQPVQGETIQSSKREIEQTLDTLNRAFEKLLDDLFEDTALDVSSDISVLQTMLAQEGLTDDELSKLKKQQNL